MKWLAMAGLVVATTNATAQPAGDPAPPPDAAAPGATADDHLARVRALYDQGDFVHARDELLAAYQLDARPELLFALGQVELNLGQFQIAIDYYQRFIASGPAAEQAALAQQAIGAARARLVEQPAAPPRPAAPPPPPHRTWDVADSGLAATGATALITGAALLAYTHELAHDRSGTLSTYNHRITRATILQWTGAGCLAGGALLVGGALLRWRLHFVDGELQPIAGSTTAGMAWVGQW